MVQGLFRNPETRRILIYLGAAGVCAILGGTVYAAAMHAVTPSPRFANALPSVSVLKPTRTIGLKGSTIRVAVADTPAEREQGLSGQTSLESDEGMLFVFPEDGMYGFWMKDMLFSLDMIWTDSTGKIVYMAQSVSPDTYPTDYAPSAPARDVIELPAGWAKAHNVSIGDTVSL